MTKKNYIVAVTGASGIIYASRLLHELCKTADVHLIISETGRRVSVLEGISLDDCGVSCIHKIDDLAAPVASGSFLHDGMIIIPCSMKTLASVAHGYSSNLIGRSADVCLKEKRPCILVLREMPLSRVHIKNMLEVDSAGATVMVASPTFYNRPETVEDLVDTVVARVLDHLKVPHNVSKRWSGPNA